MTVVKKKKLSLVKLVYSFVYSVRHSSNKNHSFLTFLYDFPAFLKYSLQGKMPVELELPWINIAALRKLRTLLNENMVVFEYGSGGSTLFFAKRIKKICSVEFNPEWYALVKGQICAKGYTNVDLHLLEPKKAGNLTAEEHNAVVNLDYSEYLNFISSFPDNYFDVIFIDGRERSLSLETSISKLRKGGIIVFDNSDRCRYQNAIEKHLHSFKMFKFYGPTVADINFSTTHIYIDSAS